VSTPNRTALAAMILSLPMLGTDCWDRRDSHPNHKPRNKDEKRRAKQKRAKDARRKNR